MWCSATNNPNSGVVLLEFDNNGFTITPMCKNTKATPQTVFAHMLYENADPYVLLEPGGYLDVSNAKYKKHKKNSVRVEGSKWFNKNPYTCLLYTSPSPRDVEESRMPSSA